MLYNIRQKRSVYLPMERVTWLDLGVYFLVYSFLGWAAEACYYAVKRRRFCNRGFLTLPFLPSYGVTFCLLSLMLPPLAGSYLLQFGMTLVASAVVESLSAQFIRRACKKLRLDPERGSIFTGSWKGLLTSALKALCFYLTYLVFHPMLMGAALLLPRLAAQILVLVLLILMALESLAILAAVLTGNAEGFRAWQKDTWQARLADRISRSIWRRFQKAYPGIETDDDIEPGEYIFAKGLCLDKLVWVFLISALLGDIIETFFCGFVNGEWMSRSSVLYGPFSFVWGLGAVVLTLVLQPLAGKNDRYVFLGGFVVGGAYEYLCSVFTELVFGTVFWDYSDMPLNIGGRTNVLFCFFWGVLSVVWVKMLYPPMSEAIEKLPAVAGKVITWVVVVFMTCNALLTCAAMLRFDTRAQRPESGNVFEEFLDKQYDDDFMARRWPNMIVVSEE